VDAQSEGRNTLLVLAHFCPKCFEDVQPIHEAGEHEGIWMIFEIGDKSISLRMIDELNTLKRLKKEPLTTRFESIYDL